MTLPELETTPKRRWPHTRAGRLAPVVLSGLCAWAAAGLPVTARAQAPASEVERAVALNEQGSELYAEGQISAALDAFERAHALVAEPNLLFNIAGCHERLGRHAEAIEYYRWFLSMPGAQPEGRRRAIASLGRLQRLAQQPPAARSSPSTPSALFVPSLPSKPLPPAPAAATGRATAAPATVAPRDMSAEGSAFWPLATLGAGMLFAGLGAGLYLDGAHDHNEVRHAPAAGASGASALTEVEAQRLIDAGDVKKQLGVVGLGLGGALIASHLALTLWSTDPSGDDQTSAEIRLIPGGWAVAGRF